MSLSKKSPKACKGMKAHENGIMKWDNANILKT
jgi:hypothetical protein